ncbi:MAG: Gfo/Idh/MocA family oxidoreductase [Bryobacteraceae bacterium]|jgi:predicted dehydrogenase
MKSVAGVTVGIGLAGKLLPAQQIARVIGANDGINVAAIGVGGRGTWVAKVFSKVGQDVNARIVAVCDVYQKRVNENKQTHHCDGYLDYREVLARKDVDAVIVATPDHWHAPIALAALEAGKDVYLEKPMTHTINEARQLVEKVKETRRVLQVGSQTTSAQQWWKAKQAIADGAIGQMIMSQGSYHRNSKEGEWNYEIDPDCGPDKKGDAYIDWKTWLGSAPKRPWDPDRFFRFRKFWDYSGGIATDLFFHVAAPLNICWPEPQFPYKVMAGGGIYVFHDTREVPDTFQFIADYKQGHSVVLTSSMANSQHIPGLIRGHLGTIIMVDHGKFEEPTDHITLKPEKEVVDEAYIAKFGKDDKQIQIEQEDDEVLHVRNFLDCVRSRQKPHLDVETAARAQVLISMSVESYRRGRVLYFDERSWELSDKPPKA